MIKLLIVDDHDVVRAGFHHILSTQPDIEVTAEADTGKAALDIIRKQAIDVAMIDLALPDMSGLDVLKQAKVIRPAMAVLILSGYSEEEYGLNVLKFGGSGFVGKQLAPEQLVAAVRRVAQGRRFISPHLAELLAAGLTDDVDQPQHTKLSEREFQVFSRLAAGKNVTEIADDLFLSVKTVSTYRSRVLEKMNFTTNADLTYYAVKHQLMP
ncbi:response regulator transcription factor [Chitinivorax sp. B]|uniref:response regulator n=1 Tax=Chitinivorax sp. B TaxID=2502235 RepID=UPI0010F8A86E|nr:response regulator transcription factor [Chitinivorax sp. B]